jgi:hypothetical protein
MCGDGFEDPGDARNKASSNKDGSCMALKTNDVAGGAAQINNVRYQLKPNRRSCSRHESGRLRARPEAVRSPGARPSAMASTMRGER